MVMIGPVSRARDLLQAPVENLLKAAGELLTSSLTLTAEALLAAVAASREKTLYEVILECSVPSVSDVDIMKLADDVSEALVRHVTFVQCGGSRNSHSFKLWVELEAPSPAIAVQRVTSALDSVNARLAKTANLGTGGISLAQLSPLSRERTDLPTIGSLR